MKKILIALGLSLFSLSSLAEEQETYYYYDKESQTLKEVTVKKKKNPHKEQMKELTEQNKKLLMESREWSGYYNDNTGEYEFPNDFK